MNEELLYLMAFKKIGNVGDKTLDNLYKKFGSFKSAWYADDENIRELRLQKKISASLLERKKRVNIGDVKNEIESILSQGIKMCSKFDKDTSLKQLYELKDAPSIVYVKGDITRVNENVIAVVGTREPSDKGRDVTRDTAQKLAGAGYTIVSGLAHGIDTEAHLGALDVHGRTIAVLGTGFNKEVFYPKENFRLFNEIVENGYCISEFPPDSKGYMYKMYRRNRIISILSKGVLIIEMSNKPHSGTLTQARYAQEQGRKVFIMECFDKVNRDNMGWKILKKEINPIVIHDYEDLIHEIEKPVTKQVNLLHYGVVTSD